MRSDGFWGIGVAEQKEMFQNATSDLMNFGLDNIVLGNSVGLAARAGSNIAPGEPIYPGKIWITDGNPRDEFLPFQLGTVNGNIAQAFELFKALGDDRTGVSDLGRGQIHDLPSRTPATTVVSALQEGKRRPDLTLKDMRYEGLSNVGLKVLQALQQNIAKPSSEAAQWLQWSVELLGMPEGQLVAEKLQTPMENVAFGLGVSLTATSGTNNKELDKQNLTTQMQMATQVADKIVQWQSLAMQDPTGILAGTVQKAISGILELFTRYLEQSDVRNIEQIIPPSQAQAPAGSAGLPAGPAAGPFGGPGGGNPAAPGIAQLAALLASRGGAVGGANGSAGQGAAAR
jgi:hypothetical protein